MRTCPTCHGEVLLDGKSPTRILEVGTGRLSSQHENISNTPRRDYEREVMDLEAKNKKLFMALHHATQKTHVTNPRACSGCEAIYECLGLKEGK